MTLGQAKARQNTSSLEGLKLLRTELDELNAFREENLAALHDYVLGDDDSDDTSSDEDRDQSGGDT